MHLQVGQWLRFRGQPRLITAITTVHGHTIVPDSADEWRRSFVNNDRVTPLEMDDFQAGDIISHDVQSIALEDAEGKAHFITVYERIGRISNGPERGNRTSSSPTSGEAEGVGGGVEGWPSDWQSFAG